MEYTLAYALQPVPTCNVHTVELATMNLILSCLVNKDSLRTKLEKRYLGFKPSIKVELQLLSAMLAWDRFNRSFKLIIVNYVLEKKNTTLKKLLKKAKILQQQRSQQIKTTFKNIQKRIKRNDVFAREHLSYTDREDPQGVIIRRRFAKTQKFIRRNLAAARIQLWWCKCAKQNTVIKILYRLVDNCVGNKYDYGNYLRDKDKNTRNLYRKNLLVIQTKRMDALF